MLTTEAEDYNLQITEESGSTEKMPTLLSVNLPVSQVKGTSQHMPTQSEPHLKSYLPLIESKSSPQKQPEPCDEIISAERNKVLDASKPASPLQIFASQNSAEIGSKAGLGNPILATLADCASRLQKYQSQEAADSPMKSSVMKVSKDLKLRKTTYGPTSQHLQTTSLDQNYTCSLSQQMQTIFDDNRSSRDALVNALQFMKEMSTSNGDVCIVSDLESADEDTD